MTDYQHIRYEVAGTAALLVLMLVAGPEPAGAQPNSAASHLLVAADLPYMEAGDPKLQILDILSLDRRGFTVYRTRDRKPFHLVLDSS